MSLFIADIMAMIFFSAVLCMGIEIFIAGMTPFQSLQARLAAIPVNLLTGRPYGVFRDRLFAFFSIDATKPVRAFFGDTLAFVIFQVPLYVIVLLTAGATWRQIALSTVFMSLIFSLAGRPYGIFLELCRKGADRLMRIPSE
ncbi:MAG: L-alanine exporter AlaE [Synergistaceae bacterium]|nr:L-alanine exporter AlaE [Synergistaceae bacterium]